MLAQPPKYWMLVEAMSGIDASFSETARAKNDVATSPAGGRNGLRHRMFICALLAVIN